MYFRKYWKKIRFRQSNFNSAINAYQGLNFNSNTVKMFTPDKVLLPNLGLYSTNNLTAHIEYKT